MVSSAAKSPGLLARALSFLRLSSRTDGKASKSHSIRDWLREKFNKYLFSSFRRKAESPPEGGKDVSQLLMLCFANIFLQRKSFFSQDEILAIKNGSLIKNYRDLENYILNGIVDPGQTIPYTEEEAELYRRFQKRLSDNFPQDGANSENDLESLEKKIEDMASLTGHFNLFVEYRDGTKIDAQYRHALHAIKCNLKNKKGCKFMNDIPTSLDRLYEASLQEVEQACQLHKSWAKYRGFLFFLKQFEEREKNKLGYSQYHLFEKEHMRLFICVYDSLQVFKKTAALEMKSIKKNIAAKRCYVEYLTKDKGSFSEEKSDSGISSKSSDASTDL